jgi:phosphatidylglycerol---prolipoprotein diacylglyceryl transferase
MLPVLFRIGGFTVTSFGVMIALSFVVGGWVLARELEYRKQDPEHAWDLCGYAAIFGILGAKIYYLFLHWPETAADPGHAILSRSGLVWYGGFILAALAVLYRLHRLKLPIPTFADACAPTLAAGYAIGRIGCFLVGDDYGRPTDQPWGVAFPFGLPETTAGNLRQLFHVQIPASVPDDTLLRVHPTQLYETAMALAIWAFGVWLFKHRPVPGTVALAVLALLAVERFLIEFLRAKDDRFFGGFTLAQGISVIVFLIVLGVGWYRHGQHRRGQVAPRTA